MNAPSVWNPTNSLPLVNASGTLFTQNFTVTVAPTTVYNLTIFNYVINTGSLRVYINGVRQVPGTDFTETSNSSFTLNASPLVGDVVSADGFVGITGVAVIGALDPATLAASSGSSLVGYIQAGAGALVTTVQARLRQLFLTCDYTTLAQAKTAAGNAPVIDPLGITNKDVCNNSSNVYSGADGSGKSGTLIRAANPGDHAGFEGYSFAIESSPLGTGSNAVISTDFGLGVSAVKRNWQTTSVIGQVCGINTVVRGGYQGAFVNMNGDIAAYIANVVTSSPDYAAASESLTAHQPGSGAIDQQVRTQVGVVNVQNANYIGFFGYKEVGNGGDLVLGQSGAGAGYWTNYYRAVKDGINNFLIDATGAIQQFTVGSSVNTTTMENSSGRWHVKNHAGAEIIGVDQNGKFVTTDYPSAPTAFTPSITPTTGAFTASIVAAYYIKRGCMVFVDIYYNISAIGSAGGALVLGIPIQATARAIIQGAGAISTGGKMTGVTFAAGSATTALINVYDGTTPCATSGSGHVSFSYESI